jgi:starch phosphorylase
VRAVRAIRRFNVQPVLPESLHPLRELAFNLRWSWHQDTKELFRAIDPVLWQEVGGDPILLLSRVSAARLATLAVDKRFLRNMERAAEDLAEYLTADLWYQGWSAGKPTAPRAIGYFSAEFGISHVLPQYSGGLGILAGDHLKAASDSGVPIIGVGLLYRHGYFRQWINAEGWQQERYPLLDPNAMPLNQLRDGDEPVTISVPLAGQELKAHIWVAQVGRVPLLMMDAAIEENPEALRAITDRLYGGGADHRLAQEVLLGIGGVRALREYCRITGRLAPDVYHCNEGHAGFLGLERIREYLAEGHDFDTAVELTRAGSVFTTHTPVPAGIDRFPKDAIARQFGDFDGLPLDRILALGSEDYEGGDPTRFNMAVMGFRLGQRANGVSKLHGAVSREMFQGLWPAFDTTEVPITSITNGVHHRTWIHPELLELLEAPTGDQETVIDGYDWAALAHVDDNTLWSLKRQMRGTMISMARERLTQMCRTRGMSDDWVANALSPHVLTLGFARRGASYKRLTLMLSDPARLKALLNHPERPVQIVIAGKSHPADDIGKSLIQQMIRFTDDPEVRGKIVFLPDYDMSLAQPLYPGCDVWVNNPLRPYEACGTSGMKAALNGAANLSIRDGWWDEWYDPSWGWEIPSAEGIADPAARDIAEATFLYEIIENEIAPRFYTVDSQGLPTRWITMIRDTISGLGPKVLASRMVQDYVTELYGPAAESSSRVSGKGTAEKLAAWKSRVRSAWPGVHVEHVEVHADDTISVGQDITFACLVQLGSLDPADVEVQLVSGDCDASDQLTDITTEPMALVADLGEGRKRYEGVRSITESGQRGYTMRVIPKHDLLVSAAEMGIAAVPADQLPA